MVAASYWRARVSWLVLASWHSDCIYQINQVNSRNGSLSHDYSTINIVLHIILLLYITQACTHTYTHFPGKWITQQINVAKVLYGHWSDTISLSYKTGDSFTGHPHLFSILSTHRPLYVSKPTQIMPITRAAQFNHMINQ